MQLLEASASQTQTGGMGIWTMVIYLVIIGVVMYFIMIRPQRKRQKEEDKMRNSLEIGDEIITIGGLYGRIISIKEDSVVVESQSDHSKQKLARWAIQQNLTVHDEKEAEAKPAKPAKAEKEKKPKKEKNSETEQK